MVLQPYESQTEDILEQWIQYKTQVPVYGAILLTPDLTKCLVVKGYGPRASWGFPKGKVNKNEKGILCAAREVHEETGFDLTGMINEKDSVELRIKEQMVKLYIVPFIDEDTEFAPLTRQEISKIEWKVVEDLPVSYNQAKEMNKKKKGNVENYYMVVPFVQKLRSWILRKKNRMNNQNAVPTIRTGNTPKQKDCTKYLQGYSPINVYKTESVLAEYNTDRQIDDEESEEEILQTPTLQVPKHRSQVQEKRGRNTHMVGSTSTGENGSGNPFLSFKIDTRTLLNVFDEN
eukprot:TRINITY_DN3185_c0_g1_i1.p1 TRINITY_DN3185_c0_g1~~TRINITY_DN3185_c0_g1_i1.p1  ORF type:complete len:289 (+),score=68.62 TRINITY_DN3185_c0_g1_i1:716-1582(+)